jgi:hypothetical protein
MEISNKKNHIHDCSNCQYLGSSNDHDYYFCFSKEYPILSTLIARFGENGDYSSGLEFVMSNTELNVALRLASEQNVLPEDVKQRIRHNQVEWFKYCETDSSYAEGIAKRWAGKERFILK